MTKLWKHMSETHNLTLTISEEQDIVNCVREDRYKEEIEKAYREGYKFVEPHNSEMDVAFGWDLSRAKLVSEGLE